MGIPDHLSCFLWNLYAGQEATVRNRHGTMDWFRIGKEFIKAVHCHPAYLIYMQSQFSSVVQSCLTLCNPMSCSMLGFPVHHQLPELAQTHVHRVGYAIQPSHPLLYPFPPSFNLSQHQGHFQWVSTSHQVAEVMKYQVQHQSSQWIFNTDFL